MSSKRKQLTLSAIVLIACFVALGFVWHSSSFLIFAFTVFVCTFCGTLALRVVVDRLILGVCLCSLLLPCFVVTGEYLSLAPAPFGNPLLLFIEPFVVLGAVFVLLFVAPICLLVSANFTRQWKRFFKLCLLCFCSVMMLGGSIFLGRKTREVALAEFADRSAPLIQAIERFDRDTGHAPKDLDDLVPKYIARIPDTGLAQPDKYDYEVMKGKHRWQLSILCSRGMLNWDEFIYRPSHDYSDVGGGWVEPMGTWGYLHE